MQESRTAAGHSFAFLRDGLQVLLRPFETGGDRTAVEGFFASVSAENRTLRFHSPVRVSAKLIDIATSGHALVAEVSGGIVAVGSYYPLRDPKRAEVALAVQDSQQGRGIGTVLMERLAADARHEGVERFVALVMASNAKMLEVLRDLGFTMSRRLDQGEWEFEISLKAAPSVLDREDERRHIAAQASLVPMFHPRSIAVVGASRHPGNPGNAIFRNLINGSFPGAVYPVNRAAHAVAAVRAYPRVSEIPDQVDLAIIAVPSESVLEVARDSLEAGVRSLVVISAGFAEVDEEGKKRQEDLLHLVRSHSARLVGPNCLGILSAGKDMLMNATFAPSMPSAGSVAIASQSGALGIAILDQAREARLGVSAFVSMGNKADLSSNDLLEYWEEDAQTEVVVLYLESFGNPRRFARVARRVGRLKPIVAVKGGRGEAGQRAAQSHTAALAGSNIAVDALFHQAGVTHCETLEESFDVALLFARQPLPAGKRVGIVSNAGGLGILCADACEANGLELPVLSQDTQSQLRALLSPTLHPANPLDVGASSSAETYRQSLNLMLDDPAIDAVIALFVPLATNSLDDAAAALLGICDSQATKPILASFAGRDWPIDLPEPAECVPVYRFPEAAARALGHAASRAAWLRRPAGELPAFSDIDLPATQAIVQRALEREQSPWLTPDEVNAILGAYRLPRPRSMVVHSAKEAADAAQQLGTPVVLKLISKTVLHKTDVGGVHLDVRSPEQAAQAYRAIEQSLHAHGLGDAFDGALVQEMVTGGVECLIGLVNDPLFGPLLAFGLGGTVAEVMGDVAFRLHPLTDVDADELLGSVKAARLLAGYRGAPPADMSALRDLLLRVSQLVEDVPEVAELDLNPVIALPAGQGVLALDARIRLERPA